MNRPLFTTNLDRCTGCAACVLACRIENELDPLLPWRSIVTINDANLSSVAVHHLSLACQHCADPPCLRGCPTGAFSQDDSSGVVLLDTEKCMGCRYCSWVCPYGAPRFDAALGVMAKCTFCAPRLEQGLEPACVAACPVEALGLDQRGGVEPAEPAVAGLPALEIGPALRITDRRRGLRPPDISPPPPQRIGATTPRCTSRWAGLRTEWSLLVFTLIASTLVAWFASALLGGGEVVAAPFVLAGLVALAVSAAHLGNPRNAWRAARNLGRSWLSREIVCFSTFFAGASGLLCFAASDLRLSWLAAGIGVVALACADMVYRVHGQRVPALPHSANTTLTAVGLTAVLSGIPTMVAVVGGLKLALFLARRPMASCRFRVPLIGVRVGVGLLLPGLMWLWGVSWTHPIALCAIASGEIVDRALFYAELRFLDPELQVERDLESVVS